MHLSLQHDGRSYYPTGPMSPPHYFRPGAGMGDLSTDQQITSIASTGATATLGILAGLHAVIGGIAFAGPIGAAIAAGITAITLVANLIEKEFSGCGQTCVIASNDANKYGDLLLQNLRAYIAAPYQPELQQAALNNFDTVWAALVAACSDPSLGDAGKRCLSDRQRGACTWKAKAGGWVSDGQGGYTWTDWGAAGSGTDCWNYFAGMRDPIQNDPRAATYVPLSTSAGSETTNTTSTGTGTDTTANTATTPNILPLLIGAGALLLLLEAH